MYELIVLDLVRQRIEQAEHTAERALLVREARPRRRRGQVTQVR